MPPAGACIWPGCAADSGTLLHTARNAMNHIWQLAHGRQLDLDAAPVLMGIVNVTPDSFSDGGEFVTADAAIARAHEMAREGAQIIDIGGESTRPGAEPITPAEEQRRIMPVVEGLSNSGLLLSVDTFREETARLALAAGAHIVNDVWGLQREPGIANVAARVGAGLVVMHTGRDRYKLEDVIADQMSFLNRSLSIARSAGVSDMQIVLDPGFGFAKDSHENIELVARFGELTGLGFPLMAGTSRKRFLGSVTGRDARERGPATAATSVLLRLAGASLFRVHDVAMNRDALAVTDAVIASRATKAV
jgi:dihydropteroate synthase